MQEEAEVQCPYCGEAITVFIDASVDEQEYVEDCSVCCRPIEFRVLCEGGALVSVIPSRSQ